MKDIKYLEISESLYIENNEIKERLNESSTPQFLSWDDGWQYVLSSLSKIMNYNEQQNTDRENSVE